MFVGLPMLSPAQNNDFSLSLYNSSKQLRLDQNTSYSLNPFRSWQMQIYSSNSEDKRLDFNQTSQTSRLSIALSRKSKLMNHEFRTGYEYLLDHSDLENELNPYSNKTGYLGYGMVFTPVDSLVLTGQFKGYYRREKDRYLDNHILISNGLQNLLSISYTADFTDKYLRIACNTDNKALDWEKFRSLTASLSAAYLGDKINADFIAGGGTKAEDLYVLTSPEPGDMSSFYDRYDHQKHNFLNTSLNLNLPLSDYFICRLSESYNLNTYLHDINRSRNTGDYNSQSQLTLEYAVTDKIRLTSNNQYSYYIKDLSYIDNSRIIETRSSNCGIAWEYNKDDSLSADYTIELRRTIYPDSGNDLDNDYLSAIWRLGWSMFLKDRLRLANRILYLQRQEVFIDSWLSANNNNLTSLQWQPEIDLLIGDCLMLKQEYQLRADYDDYLYNDFSGIKDTFYRQAGTSCHLIYDTSPLAAKLEIPIWADLPFRSRDLTAFRLDLGYAWERNETSSKEGDIYYINGRYDRQTLSLLLQKQHGIVIGQIFPKYSWGNWKEMNLLVSAAIKMNSNSSFELSLNPLGPDLDSLDWRFGCNLALAF